MGELHIGEYVNEFVLTMCNDVWTDINIRQFIEFCEYNVGKDVAVRVNQESHCCRHMGVYDILDMFSFSSVTILTANALEHHDTYTVMNNSWPQWIANATITPDMFGITSGISPNMLFGAIYGRPSEFRVGILANLLNRHEHKTFAAVRFSTRGSLLTDKVLALGNTVQYLPYLIKNLDRYTVDIDAYTISGGYNYNTRELNELYKNFAIDIVSEPNNYGNTFYPTEKIARPLVFRRPFVVMGPRNYLKNLRRMGFRTFGDHWSEEYDQFDGKDRYIAIIKLLDELSTRNPLDVMASVGEIVQHNMLIIRQYRTISSQDVRLSDE